MAIGRQRDIDDARIDARRVFRREAEASERTRTIALREKIGLRQEIAQHACRKYSGRVGRCAAAKTLAEDAVNLAVIARIRHLETRYDELLNDGLDRHDARAQVQPKVSEVLKAWRSSA